MLPRIVNDFNERRLSLCEACQSCKEQLVYLLNVVRQQRLFMFIICLQKPKHNNITNSFTAFILSTFAHSKVITLVMWKFISLWFYLHLIIYFDCLYGIQRCICAAVWYQRQLICILIDVYGCTNKLSAGSVDKTTFMMMCDLCFYLPHCYYIAEYGPQAYHWSHIFVLS